MDTWIIVGKHEILMEMFQRRDSPSSTLQKQVNHLKKEQSENTFFQRGYTVQTGINWSK